jgi:hypothetical protein
MRLQKCKKDWDEKLYHYARKRFNKISNIGWYKMFMNRVDFIHDNYLRYISKEENFDNCENFSEYCKRFNVLVISYQKNSFSLRSKQGQEYDSRFQEYNTEQNWELIEQNFTTGAPKDDFSIYLTDKYYIKKFLEGYTFIEVAKEQDITAPWARVRFLKEVSTLKDKKQLRETLLQYV